MKLEFSPGDRVVAAISTGVGADKVVQVLVDKLLEISGDSAILENAGKVPLIHVAKTEAVAEQIAQSIVGHPSYQDYMAMQKSQTPEEKLESKRFIDRVNEMLYEPLPPDAPDISGLNLHDVLAESWSAGQRDEGQSVAKLDRGEDGHVFVQEAEFDHSKLEATNVESDIAIEDNTQTSD